MRKMLYVFNTVATYNATLNISVSVFNNCVKTMLRGIRPSIIYSQTL